ncbi:MAG: hypothetical protein AAF363_13920 [Bacteroidota bacterium]
MKLPELGDYEVGVIIISEIVNNRNRVDDHARDLYDELTNRTTQIEGLTLVDRQKTKVLLNEFEFQQTSGLVKADQIRKLGDFFGSGFIAFGRVQRDEFDDEVISQKKFAEVNGCKTTRYRKATYDLHLNFKLVNLQTAEVVFSKNLISSLYLNSKKYDCQTPPRFNKNDIYPQCVTDIGQKFKNLFVKHEVEYKVIFQKHPKINSGVREAITYFNINEFDKGLAIISDLSHNQSNKKAKSAALYNLALVQLHSGDHKKSLSNAKEAYILNPKNTDCLTIVNSLK